MNTFLRIELSSSLFVLCVHATRGLLPVERIVLDVLYGRKRCGDASFDSLPAARVCAAKNMRCDYIERKLHARALNLTM